MAFEPTSSLQPRLHRGERVAGLFVGLALLLLMAAFVGYVLHRGIRQGWFLQRIPYYIYLADATGLKVGDPVKMMGFDIGRIVEVKPMPPDYWFMTNRYNVFVRFEVVEPNYGYIWTDSFAKVNPVDLLGNRQIEVMQGVVGDVTVTNRADGVVQVLSEKVSGEYVDLTPETKGVWLATEETAAVSERVHQVVKAVETALPMLTNQLHAVLSGTLEVLSNLNTLSRSAQPAAANLVEITSHLRDPDGSFGRWLFSTNLEPRLQDTLSAASQTLTSLETNLDTVVTKLGPALDNLAGITSNLNVQVQANTNLLSEVAKSVRETDYFIQGLRRHWFLRGAFKKMTNAPPE